MKDIYTAALRVLPASDIDHHETDLYIKASAAAAELVAAYDFLGNVEMFVSPLDGCKWYDIPFAYNPAWEEKISGRETENDCRMILDAIQKRLERENNDGRRDA